MDLPAPGQLGLGIMGKRSVARRRESPEAMATCHYLRIKRQFFWVQPNRGFFDTRIQRFRKDTNPYCRNGVPDILWVYQGQLIGIEMKRPKGGRQSDAQKEFQKDLEDAGGIYILAKGADDAITQINAILKI